MAQLTYTEVAKWAGISRAKLYRMINNGDISTVKARDGKNRIESSECVRVFENFRCSLDDTSVIGRDKVSTIHREMESGHVEAVRGRSNSEAILQVKIEFLEQQLAESKEREERTRIEAGKNERLQREDYRERERHHQEAEKEFRAIIKSQTLLLSDQREVKVPEPIIPPPVPKQATVEPDELAVPKSDKNLKKTKKDKKGKRK